MTSPMVRSAGSVVGWVSRSPAKEPNPTISPTAKHRDEGSSASSAASRATSANRSWAMKALASESFRM